VLILRGLANFAQDSYFSNFSANVIYINPAFVSSTTSPEASVTYRNQWPGIRDAFVTYGASFSVPLTKYKSGLGFYFLKDMQGGGVITSTSVTSIYAYNIKISPDINLNAGLCASYNFRNLNTENLIFESMIRNNTGINDGQPVFESVKSRFWDFSLGFMAEIYRMLDIGFSIQHITQPKNYFSSSSYNMLYRNYSLHASCYIPLTKGYGVNSPVFIPSLLFQKYKHHHQLLYGTAFSVWPLLFGIWTKNDLQFRYSSLTAMIGFIQPSYKLVYNYDINLTRTNFMSYNMGAHEITFLLRILDTDKRKKIRAIKCPRL
jgi:type IX secretion system PorP/SprF family membrane protein